MQKMTILPGLLATGNWIQRLLEVRLPIAAVNGLPDYRMNSPAVDTTRSTRR
jgi:hypothetical protein